MGLPVHHMISYHLNSLTQILPNVAKFHIKAGEWSLDPHTSNYEKAKQYFENVYNGSASTDNKLTEYDVYTVKREYARVLNILGYYEDAIHIYKSILKTYPLDLGVGFLLRDSVHALASSRDDVDTCDSLDSSPELHEYLKQGQDFNRLIVSSSVNRNEYKGFIPGSNWQPKRFNHMLTPEEFQGFIERREPFVISFGSINNIGTIFNPFTLA